MTTRMQRFSVFAGVALGLGVASSARATEFGGVDILIDLPTNTAQGEVRRLDGERRKVTRADEIVDGAFVKADVRIRVDDDSSGAVMKRLDQAFRSEPAGCAPGEYGALEMEAGLKYFFDLSPLTQEQKRNFGRVSATLYPGDRATNWANDVFCEFDPDLGEKAAVLRFTGFFYVIHRKTGDGMNIQMRAVELTAGQIYEFERENGLLPDPADD